MTLKSTIEAKLHEAFSPVTLSVVDESYLHASHAQAPAGGESHFRVQLVSSAFEGQTRLTRQRAVYAVHKSELEAGLHALRLDLATPKEASSE